MADKVTIMVVEVVDLHCYSCYKKIKKVLCKFPEIRNQVYDEKANTVTITVVCCNPEKIRDKLYCKGRKIIVRIVIKPPPPTPTPPPPPPPVPPPPPPPPPVTNPLDLLVSVRVCCGHCCAGHPVGPCYQRCRCDYFNEENTSGCTIM